MIQINSESNGQTQLYKRTIAEQQFQSNVPLFGFVPSISQELFPSKSIKFNHNQAEQCFADKVMIGEQTYNLVVQYLDEQYLLLSNNKSFTIKSHKINIQSTFNPNDLDILLGPALILNLAFHAVFLLHASAVKIKKTVFVFPADSGTGKSTIARSLSTNSNHIRLTDDMSALGIADNAISFHSGFPQLKLNTEPDFLDKNAYNKVVLMFPDSKSNQSISQLCLTESIRQIISHSVATRLFSRQHLTEHFEFCEQLAKLATCYQFTYTHSKKSIDKLREYLYEFA
ncbi:MAG: hypothetical protein L3J52_08935 [Proteobacteria bacterium]|nr:hypothetical protein [Pseudomonadota bacterium]